MTWKHAAGQITLTRRTDDLRRIRTWLLVFIAGLIVSGIIAFPLQTELEILLRILHTELLTSMAASTGLLPWIERVSQGISETNHRYPFLAYGTDWLAFAHLIIAVAFIGPYRDPGRNRWLITFGLISCAGVVPLALIAGSVCHIPFAWRLLDCSFEIGGAMPLLVCRKLIVELEKERAAEEQIEAVIVDCFVPVEYLRALLQFIEDISAHFDFIGRLFSHSAEGEGRE